MKKVFKFVKSKREEKKEQALQQCIFPDDQFRRQNVPEANANFAAELNCGYTIDTSGKDKTVTKLHKAAWQGNVEKLKVNLKKIDVDITDRLNRTPLHLAAANGHSNVVWFLLNNKAKLNICDNEGKVPFLKAIEGGHKDTVQLMLERGADINTIDYSGNSALHVAAMKGFINISSMLLKQGANFEIANNVGEYPLHIATQAEHKDLVELLLRYGSSVNIVDRENRSPIMFAAKSGNMPLVQLFLEYGAQLGIMDCNDWTAEDYALLGGQHEVASELKTPSHALVLPYHETIEKREDVKRSISTVSISESQSKHIDKVVSSGNMKIDGVENCAVWSNKKEMDSNFKCKSTGLNLSNFLHTSDDDISEESQEPRTPGRKEEDSPRSCVIPPPCKPPRSWDLIQSGVIDDPQNQEPRRRSFLFGSLRSKHENFVESQQGTDYESLLGDCGHGDSDLWIMSQSFGKYNDKPTTQSQNVSKADVFNEQNSQAMRNFVEKSDSLIGNNDTCKSEVIAMEFSKDSLKDSSSDDWDSDDSLPMDNGTAVILVKNASPVKEKINNESQNICETSNISSEKRGRLLVRATSIDLTDDDGQPSKEKSNSSKSSSENDKAQNAESDEQPSANKENFTAVQGSLETDGTLGREGTLRGYEELWESNPHLVIQAMDFPGSESKSVVQKSIQEEMDEAEAQANSLLFTSFLDPKLVDSCESKNILTEDLSPGNKSIEDRLIFKSPMLEQKTKPLFNDENLMSLAAIKNTELSKRSNQKFESRSLDDLDECIVSKGLSEIKTTHARKHSRQQSISVLSWSKSEEISHKPPTTNFSRLVADNKHINAQLQCYDEAIRELAQVSMVKKQTSLPLPQKSELWDPAASRFFGVKNQRYLSLPRTNELIDEAFKEIGESSVKLKQSSRSLPRTITAKHIYLEGDRISFPRQKKSSHRRRRAESEGETFFNTSVNNIDKENSLETSTYQPKRVESDSSLLKPVFIPPTFLKDDTISPNGSETPHSDLSSSSVREHSKEKPLRKKRKALLAMRCLKGQHKELVSGNTMASISVEETLDKPLFWLSSDKRNSLERQVTVIERPTLKPRTSSPIKLEVDIISGTGSPLADSDDNVPPLPPPLSFMTPGSPKTDFSENKEVKEDIIGSAKCTKVSENQLLQSESEEHKIADQKDSQSDGDSEQSQIDSIPMKKHHSILKEQLQVATLKHGQLQRTTAELGEKAEQLRYELAEAHETARSQGEMVFLLKEQLSNMETIHATCLEGAHLTQLRIANLEQELSHLQDICQKSSEDQFQLNQIINSRNIEIAQLLKIVEEKCDGATQLVKEPDNTDCLNKVEDENLCLKKEVVTLRDKNDELLLELQDMKQKYLTLLKDKNGSYLEFQGNQSPQEMDRDPFVKFHKILHELKELWLKEFDYFNNCKEQLEKFKNFKNEESENASIEVNFTTSNIFMEIQKCMDICQEFHNKIESVLLSDLALPFIKEASTVSVLSANMDGKIYLPEDEVMNPFEINAIQFSDNEDHSNKEEIEQFLLNYKSELHTFEEELNNILKKINIPKGPECLTKHFFLSLIKLKALYSKPVVSQGSQPVQINEMFSPGKYTTLEGEIRDQNHSGDTQHIIDKITQENQKLKDELQEKYEMLELLTKYAEHHSNENNRLVLCLTATSPNINSEPSKVEINPLLSDFEPRYTWSYQSQYTQTENNSESLFQEILIENTNLKLELQKAKIEFEELEKELKAIVLMKEPSISLNTVDPEENDELRRKVKELEQVISKQEEELNGCESDSLKILEMSQHSHVPGIYDQLYQENLELTAQLQAMKDEKDELELSYRTLIENVKQNNLVDSIVRVNDISSVLIPNNNEKNETINGCKHNCVMNEGTPDLKNNNIVKSCTSECKCMIKLVNEGILNNIKLNDDEIGTSLFPQSIKKACVKELGQSLKILEFTKENRASCNIGKQNILHSSNSNSKSFTENPKKVSKLRGSCSFEYKTSCDNDCDVNFTTEELVYEESAFQQACISVENKNFQHSDAQTIIRNAETDLSHNSTDDIKDELAVSHHGYSNKCKQSEGEIKCSRGNKIFSSKMCKSPNKSNVENVSKINSKSSTPNRCCMSESDIKKLSSFTTSVKCAQSLTGCDQRNTHDNCTTEPELKVNACSSSLLTNVKQFMSNNEEFGSENFEKNTLKYISSENITNESLSSHQKGQRKSSKRVDENEFMSATNDPRKMGAGNTTSAMNLGNNFVNEKYKHDADMVHSISTFNLNKDSSRAEDHEISISSTETESDTDSKTLSSRCSEQVFCICQSGENCRYCINLHKLSESSIDPAINSFKSRKFDILPNDCKCNKRDKDKDTPEKKTTQKDYMKEYFQEETKEKSSIICSINDTACSSQIKENLSNNTKRSHRCVYKQSRIPTYTRGIGSSGNESSPSQSVVGIRKNGKYSFSSKQRKSFSESESSASTNISDLICKSNRDVATNTSDLNATHDLQKELQTEKERVRKHAQSIKKLKSELQQMKSRVHETKNSGKLESNILSTKYKLYSSSAPHSPMHYDLSLAEFQRQVNELQQKVKEEHSLRFSLEVQVNKMRYELQEKFQLEKELSLLRNQLEKEFVSKAEIEHLKKSYETALNKAKQDAELCIRDDFSSKLSQINNFIEKQVQEQAHNDHLRNSESQLRQDCQETHLKLLSDLAKVQVTLHEKGEKEKELREKYERLSKECERKQELRTKKLVEKSYNVNLTPYSNSKDKDINSKGYVLDIHSPIHSSNLQSVHSSQVPISMNISNVNDNWMQENSLSQMLRWELEKNIRKHSRTDQLSDQPCSGTSLHESDDHLELLKNKYFLH